MGDSKNTSETTENATGGNPVANVISLHWAIGLSI